MVLLCFNTYYTNDASNYPSPLISIDAIDAPNCDGP